MVISFTLAGGWDGFSASFGPFTLADGQYDIEWEDPAGTWLYEQSAEVTLVSDGSVVGSGVSPYFLFLGAGFLVHNLAILLLAQFNMIQ